MKKILIGMLCMTAFIFSATAQETREKKEKPAGSHHQKDMKFKKLNLSEDQKAQAKANKADAKKQIADLDADKNLSPEEYKAKKEAIQKAQKDKMKSILTDDQKSQLAKDKADRKQEHKEKMEKVKTDLNLSDDQVAKMKASHKAQQSAMKAIKDDNTLSASEKKEKLNVLKEKYKSEYKNTLTPEQLQKMEEMKKDKKGKH